MKPSRRPAVRAARHATLTSVSIYADLSDIDALIDGLEGNVDAAIRPAAQAGIEVLYQEVRANVKRLGEKSGNLYASIYQAYSDDSTPKRAIYHTSWRTRGNGVRAPHGHLIEYGRIQRYAVYFKNGRWHTAIRPSMRGKKPPARNASQAVKDGYYVLRKGGPVQIPAQSFVRKAASKMAQAEAATREKFWEMVGAT